MPYCIFYLILSVVLLKVKYLLKHFPRVENSCNLCTTCTYKQNCFIHRSIEPLQLIIHTVIYHVMALISMLKVYSNDNEIPLAEDENWVQSNPKQFEGSKMNI